MILRLDDTDVERNTEASVSSIFDGLRWLVLSWDEEYKQSERLRTASEDRLGDLREGLAYRDFTPAHAGAARGRGRREHGSSTQACENFRGLKATAGQPAGEPFALRFRVPREACGQPVCFLDAVYGEQAKSAADIEDFALLRSDGMPTYHLASCADDADLRISHIIRGQDHLTNTFKHVLIFEAAGRKAAAVRPLAAAGGARRHQAFQTAARAGGQRDHLPRCRVFARGLYQLSLLAGLVAEERSRADERDGIGAGIFARRHQSGERGGEFQGSSYQPEETFDPKAVWLNAETCARLSVEDLSARLLPIVCQRGVQRSSPRRCCGSPCSSASASSCCVTCSWRQTSSSWISCRPMIQPSSSRKRAMRLWLAVLERAREVLAHTEFKHDPLDRRVARCRAGVGRQGGADVSTHPGCSVRAKERAAIV